MMEPCLPGRPFSNLENSSSIVLVNPGGALTARRARKSSRFEGPPADWKLRIELRKRSRTSSGVVGFGSPTRSTIVPEPQWRLVACAVLVQGREQAVELPPADLRHGVVGSGLLAMLQDVDPLDEEEGQVDVFG
jgi:hypothetical protein